LRSPWRANIGCTELTAHPRPRITRLATGKTIDSHARFPDEARWRIAMSL
jgi:hypothetical protein